MARLCWRDRGKCGPRLVQQGRPREDLAVVAGRVGLFLVRVVDDRVDGLKVGRTQTSNLVALPQVADRDAVAIVRVEHQRWIRPGRDRKVDGPLARIGARLVVDEHVGPLHDVPLTQVAIGPRRQQVQPLDREREPVHHAVVRRRAAERGSTCSRRFGRGAQVELVKRLQGLGPPGAPDIPQPYRLVRTVITPRILTVE